MRSVLLALALVFTTAAVHAGGGSSTARPSARTRTRPATQSKRAVIYLHGHPGKPNSPKIAGLQKALRAKQIDVHAPDLNRGTGGKAGFTIGRAMREVERIIRENRLTDVVIVGASMGGRTAAHLAEKGVPEVKGVVLYAPAVGIDPAKVEGEAAQRDLQHRAPYPQIPRSVRARIYHGTEDTVVPVERSRAFHQHNPNAELRVMKDDHGLRTQSDEVVRETADFVRETLDAK